MSARVQHFVLPIMMAVAIVAGPALTLVAAPPLAGEPVLVLAAEPEALVRAAGGSLVGPRAAPFGALAFAPDAAFLRRLDLAGAWLVRDGRLLAQICGAV